MNLLNNNSLAFCFCLILLTYIYHQERDRNLFDTQNKELRLQNDQLKTITTEQAIQTQILSRLLRNYLNKEKDFSA
jgi:hypothetical protein